ncbi:uncharacterized protein [Rutidosis leptorrhynchoides]|uniref:uncharacterized protein n=1 Tax=Rutidosis leptorrhynchoides TaxID=125765 RepID=UPI003A993B42
MAFMSPKKLNIFIWRLHLNKIPTLSNLADRGVIVNNDQCIFFQSVIEDIDHLFTTCCYTTPLWRSFNNWWGLNNETPSGVNNVISGRNFQIGSDALKLMCLTSIYVLLWSIWKWRNKVVHSPAQWRSVILNEDILVSEKLLAHLWISNRKKRWSISLEEWKQDPGASRLVEE